MRIKFLKFINLLPLLVCCLFADKLSAQISTGLEEIKVSRFAVLKLSNKLAPDCYREDYYQPCLPNTILTLTQKSKIFEYPSIIAPWEGSFFIYFVKLTSKSYAIDLDSDGYKEVAIYPAVAGNNPKTKAYIYTLKDKELLPYGTGDHYWESGKHIVNIKKDPHFKPDL